MDAITSIKEELIKQKQEIEKMYGKVVVENTNPSPAEITAGIKSIPSVDLSFSNATEEDVKQGKTFYSGSPVLKTGTAVFDSNTMNALFLAKENVQTFEDQFYVTIPTYLNKITRYKFFNNSNKVQVQFHNGIEEIDEYAFYKTYNFDYVGFDSLTNLKTMNNYAFAYSSCNGVDIGNLPHSLTYIGQYCFYQVSQHNVNFRFPNNLTSIGAYTFMANERLMQKNLDLSNYKLTSIYSNCFYYHCFDCDFVAPSTLKTLCTYCFYNGGFHKVTIPETITSLESYCFSGSANHASENFYLKKVVFESETPPKIGTKVFALQNIDNGMKIYVPDNAVDDYKAVSNLSYYVDVILPMSQMP